MALCVLIPSTRVRAELRREAISHIVARAEAEGYRDAGMGVVGSRLDGKVDKFADKVDEVEEVADKDWIDVERREGETSKFMDLRTKYSHMRRPNTWSRRYVSGKATGRLIILCRISAINLAPWSPLS